jgi:predicted NBD/HSP70 family sugar kinase
MILKVGIDVGGTKIAGVAMDANGDIVAQSRQPTPREDYDATIRCIREMVAELSGAAPCSVGIGIPGSVSRKTGKVHNANSTWINASPLQQDLEKALGKPVRLANDANCLALSEAADGAGAGAQSVFAVILGTGCGGGFVINGRLNTGPHAIAGEWGHNPLPWPNGPASCPARNAGAARPAAWKPGLPDRRLPAIISMQPVWLQRLRTSPCAPWMARPVHVTRSTGILIAPRVASPMSSTCSTRKSS